MDALESGCMQICSFEWNEFNVEEKGRRNEIEMLVTNLTQEFILSMAIVNIEKRETVQTSIHNNYLFFNKIRYSIWGWDDAPFLQIQINNNQMWGTQYKTCEIHKLNYEFKIIKKFNLVNYHSKGPIALIIWYVGIFKWKTYG